MELNNVLDMATKLCLIPIEVNPDKKCMIALGVTGGLVSITFSKIKQVYSAYISGNIPAKYKIAMS